MHYVFEFRFCICVRAARSFSNSNPAERSWGIVAWKLGIAAAVVENSAHSRVPNQQSNVFRRDSVGDVELCSCLA
jgi:hypothetical protein